MHIYAYIKSASSALNKRADQRLTACAAFPEKLRGLLGSGPGPEAERRSAVTELGGPPPTWCGSSAIFVRGSAFIRAAAGTQQLGGRRWSWVRPPRFGCGCFCYSCPRCRAARRSQVRSGQGRAHRWGSGSGRVPGRSSAPLALPCCRRRCRAVAAAAQSWAAGTAALRSREYHWVSGAAASAQNPGE